MGSLGELDHGLLLAHCEEWLDALNAAVTQADIRSAEALFADDAYWRDVASLTADLGHRSGPRSIGAALIEGARRAGATNFRLQEGSTPPKACTRLLRDVVEAFIAYDTTRGTGKGVLRFAIDGMSGAQPRAWILLTMVRSIDGVAIPNEGVRPPGVGYDLASTENWSDRRRKAADYDDREPDVLIVGAGHAGLMLASHLARMDVDTLVVEKTPRLGDVWRNRYHSLALHNKTDMVQFPYMPFPSTFPEYLPKDVVGNWLEAFAINLNVDVWLSTEFLGDGYDATEQRWTARVRRADGSEQVLRPRHLVIATGGAGAQPNVPSLPGADRYTGEMVHSSRFRDASGSAGKNVLVVGSGTSAHDLALDLFRHGANVTMMQRSPTLIVTLQSSEVVNAQFSDGTPLAEADLVAAANFILPLMFPSMQATTKMLEELDRPLLDRLDTAGFKLSSGPDGAGYIFLFYENGGGYYIDVGCSEHIANGDIALVAATDFAEFDEHGAWFTGERHVPLDMVVLATGFQNQEQEVRRYFGDGVADAVGKVSGFGEGGELRNAYRPTAQPGLWFMVSGFAFARVYSGVLALQIKADLMGSSAAGSTD